MKLETIPFKIDAIHSVAQYDQAMASEMRRNLIVEFLDHVSSMQADGYFFKVQEAASKLKDVFAMGLP